MQTLIESATLSAHKRQVKLMGNVFEITVVAETEHEANYHINETIAEIQRIEKLLTTFKDDSQTNLINKYAGIKPVAVDKEVFDLIYRSQKISALTQGAFDITYGSVDKRLWNFDTKMTSLPDKELAHQSVRLINYRNIILNAEECKVFLKHEGMRIGFGGIGKGYAADKAKQLLQNAGVRNGIINASGDLCAWGTQPNGQPWTIGVADPDLKHTAFSYLNITGMAVATSGSYEKYAVIDGKKYSHTIDPRTGLPVTGVKSATIICPSAELADAMATPLIVMGINASLNMIDQMKNIACIIIDDEDRMYTSKNIRLCE